MNPRVAKIVLLVGIGLALLGTISVSRSIRSKMVRPTVDNLRFRKQPPKDQKELEKPKKTDYSIVNSDTALEVLPPPKNGPSAAFGSEKWKYVRKVSKKEEGYVAEKFLKDVEQDNISSDVQKWTHETSVWITTVPELVALGILASIIGVFKRQPKKQSDAANIPTTPPLPSRPIAEPAAHPAPVIAIPARKNHYIYVHGRAIAVPRRTAS